LKILCVGDRIFDSYQFCKATRLCPEACAPVLHIQSERTSEGGASNIAENLKSLMGGECVLTAFGSISYKHRVFADRTLICRIDRDGYSVLGSDAYWKEIQSKAAVSDWIVVGDYGKGAITPGIASGLVALGKPLFVDAKHNQQHYKGCYAFFPNEDEHNGIQSGDYQHVIRKLGPRGCSVDGILVPTKEEQQVYDVTGAGDVFLAAFVWKYSTSYPGLPKISLVTELLECARVANLAAGISVRHLGTYVVRPEEID